MGSERDEQAELRAERDRLARRVTDLEEMLSWVARPMLNEPPEQLRGYLALEREERRFTTHALISHPELVSAWYLHLALLHEAIDTYRTRPKPDATPTADVLRLGFIAASGGTAKLVLDATLAGYYTQALALVRHMFETWIRLEYLRLNPGAADRWLVDDDGRPPKPPKEEKIHDFLRKQPDYKLKHIVEQTIRTARTLNVMAHPSQNTLQQTKGVRPGQVTIGANYEPDLCVKTLHEGMNALRLILTALGDVLNAPQEWRVQVIQTTRQGDEASHLEVERREARIQKTHREP
jgi:hypothetical protein